MADSEKGRGYGDYIPILSFQNEKVFIKALY